MGRVSDRPDGEYVLSKLRVAELTESRHWESSDTNMPCCSSIETTLSIPPASQTSKNTSTYNTSSIEDDIVSTTCITQVQSQTIPTPPHPIGWCDSGSIILPYQQPDSFSTPISKMPSHLRLQAQFEPFSANATYQTSPTSPPSKKQKMSLTQTYYVASTARSKLGREANKSDHNLRLLVGHANLLDSLMLELSSAEQEQERWFNESVQKANKPDQPKHIQWIDTIAEAEEMDEDDESDAESEYEDEDEIFNIPLRKVRSPPVVLESADIDMDDSEEEEEEDDDEEDDEEHALIRVPSSRHSPPELVEDSEESDSEDESMPTSPESQEFALDDKQREQITTTAFYDVKAQRGLEDYIMQQAQQAQAPLIAAY